MPKLPECDKINSPITHHQSVVFNQSVVFKFILVKRTVAAGYAYTYLIRVNTKSKYFNFVTKVMINYFLIILRIRVIA